MPDKTFRDFGIDTDMDFAGEKKLLCPECSHTRKKKTGKCLNVNVEKGVWHCFHCGYSGTIKTGIEFKSETKYTKKYRRPDYKLTSLPQKAIKWFADRKISEQTLKDMSIGFGSMWFGEGYYNALQFPYYRNGEVINIKHRSGNKHFCMEKNAERILYNYDNAIDDSAVIITEGECDTLSFIEAGYLNCVSVPDGAPSPTAKNYEKKFEFLENCEEILKDKEGIYLAVDNDLPGLKLREELARRLGQERCLIIDWPEGCKDANEVLIKLGKEVLRECVDNARHYPIDGIISVSDFQDRLDNLYATGYKRGASLGWDNLDPYYTVQVGEWTLITGVPGHGKSQLLDNFLIRLANIHGWSFGIFSPENQPLERHAAKLIQIKANEPFSETMNEPKMSCETYYHNREFINDNFQFILPKEENSWSLDAVLELARVIIFRKGIKGIVIDPWNELEHFRPNQLTETEYISECLSKIRRFARKHAVHIWLVAHPRKMQKDNQGMYPVPHAYTISGSAHWFNKGDNIMAIWRNIKKNDSPVIIQVQKIRFTGITGKPGVAKLQYNSSTGIYSDYHEPYPGANL